MTRLPRVTATDIVKALKKAGFELVRQSGSHMIFRNIDGRRTTLPFHTGKTLHPKLLKSILKDADLSVEAFNELL
ncbi:MAG: type II toxin-antitoxin system HicA family toxin [Gammaproteobacteria bacterium]